MLNIVHKLQVLLKSLNGLVVKLNFPDVKVSKGRTSPVYCSSSCLSIAFSLMQT